MNGFKIVFVIHQFQFHWFVVLLEWLKMELKKKNNDWISFFAEKLYIILSKSTKNNFEEGIWGSPS